MCLPSVARNHDMKKKWERFQTSAPGVIWPIEPGFEDTFWQHPPLSPILFYTRQHFRRLHQTVERSSCQRSRLARGDNPTPHHLLAIRLWCPNPTILDQFKILIILITFSPICVRKCSTGRSNQTAPKGKKMILPQRGQRGLLKGAQ